MIATYIVTQYSFKIVSYRFLEFKPKAAPPCYTSTSTVSQTYNESCTTNAKEHNGSNTDDDIPTSPPISTTSLDDPTWTGDSNLEKKMPHTDSPSPPPRPPPRHPPRSDYVNIHIGGRRKLPYEGDHTVCGPKAENQNRFDITYMCTYVTIRIIKIF